MKGQQERAQKRLEFANQVSRLQNQLAYEKQRDTLGESCRILMNGTSNIHVCEEYRTLHLKKLTTNIYSTCM